MVCFMEENKIKTKWNIFEILLLTIGLLSIMISFLLIKEKNILTLISSTLGLLTVFFTAKGLFFAPFLNLVFCIIYTFIAYQNRYYGEMFIYIFIMLPLVTMSIINWYKNRNTETSEVKINKISKKEYIYLFLISIGLTVALYFLLKVLNTAELLVSTISITTSAIATYLLLRRSSNYAIFYILNDIILIVLWGLVLFKSDVSVLPMVISFIVFLVSDSYGIFRWKRKEKEQNKSNDSDIKDLENNTDNEL